MYSNTLTLNTDLKFNLNPSFRMSLKSFRYPSNSTSFRSPQFTKMPGTGGTGAYGDVSDGLLYINACRTQSDSEFYFSAAEVQKAKKYSVGKNVLLRFDGAHSNWWIQTDDKVVHHFSCTCGHSSHACMPVNAGYFFGALTKNCTQGFTFKYEITWGSDNDTNNNNKGHGLVIATKKDQRVPGYYESSTILTNEPAKVGFNTSIGMFGRCIDPCLIYS